MRALSVARGLLVLTLALAGCQGPDVGQSCTLREPTLQNQQVSADVLEAGNAACDSLVCIQSPANLVSGTKLANNPYCSKPCVSNDDCYPGDTGLVCRPVTVDPAYLATLSPAAQEQYRQLLNCPAGTDLPTCARTSSYCAVPVK